MASFSPQTSFKTSDGISLQSYAPILHQFRSRTFVSVVLLVLLHLDIQLLVHVIQLLHLHRYTALLRLFPLQYKALKHVH